MPPTLTFDNVSKLYQQRHHNAPDTELWAVRDVSFTCNEGEVVGLVGRNGCGKSTLMKLAANVTAPSTGTITSVKPIAPMLELGAGFHPDLTGRDNIKLNGSLLGLGRRMTAAQIDQIVEFAGVEAHIDTPVKHYSSGMTARLGFAVAVHSPAHLLLVDEVLSVGDKLFQQKCFERMNELRRQGTTILLVSHDDWWIRNFCDRALLVDGGRVLNDTTPDEALQAYDLRLFKTRDAHHHGIAVTRVDVLLPPWHVPQELIGDAVQIRIAYDAGDAASERTLVAHIRRQDGIYCATCISAPLAAHPSGEVVLELADLHLVVGRYVIEVAIEDASSLAPLVTHVSDPFYVPGPFDARRGYEGIINVRRNWTFHP
jgi:ABC-type polysaccharide/polyol phosphate transport system ATPase subunit